MKSLIAVLVVSLSLFGCSSGVKRPDDTAVNKINLSEINQVSSVSISLTEEAKKKSSENLKFNQNKLLDHVQRALEASSLIDGNKGNSLPTINIEVTDMRIRSNFSAVMWGFMAGADSITGDIVVKSSDGTEVERFEVSVSYALGGFSGGQDESRMGWLYEKFAEETVNELMGNKVVTSSNM